MDTSTIRDNNALETQQAIEQRAQEFEPVGKTEWLSIMSMEGNGRWRDPALWVKAWGDCGDDWNARQEEITKKDQVDIDEAFMGQKIMKRQKENRRK